MTPFLSTNNIRICGVILSLLFSGIAVGYQNVIGRDSILYVESAQRFLDGGLSEAMSIFRWPFYSILFGSAHNFSGIPLEISARIVDAILIAILVDAFFRLYQETFPGTKNGWIAMVTILAFGGLNDYRDEIIRDWGFLAFSLRSFVYLLRTFKTPSVSNSIYWQLCIIVAFLFRIEAIVFMSLAPVILLFRKDQLRTRLINFAVANALPLLIVIVLASVIFYFEINVVTLGRVHEIIFYTNFSKSFDIISKTTDNIQNYVIPYHGSDYATTFLLSGIFGILFLKTFAKIGVFFNGLFLLGYFRSRSPCISIYSRVIAYFAIIAFSIVYVFFLHFMVLAGRYILLTSILVLILVCYFFEQFFIHCTENKKTGTLIFVSILVIVNISIGLLHSTSSKEYLMTLGKWVSHNISESAVLISNDTRLYYYSARKVPFDRIMHGIYKPKVIIKRTLSGTHYALLRIDADNTEFNAITNSSKLLKIKEICNSKGHCAVLYGTKVSTRKNTNKNPMGLL